MFPYSISRMSACGKFFVVAGLMFTAFINSHAQEGTNEPRTGTISGRVVNESGQPLIGAAVIVRSTNASSTVRSTTTNLEGKFQVSGLQNSLYYVSANSPAYVTTPVNIDEPAPTVRVGDSVQLELVRGGVITGKVTNSTSDPVLGVRVRAFLVRDATGKPTRGAVLSFGERQTDDRGIYRIYGLVPGTYIVQAGGGGGYSTLNATDLDAPTYAPSSTRDSAAEIQVRGGEETTVDIRYRGEQGHTISGTVKMQGSSGASISLTQVGDGIIPTSSSFQPAGSRGFQMSGIGDGEYVITAQEVVSGITTSVPDLAMTIPVRITVKGADVTGLELVPKPLATISGKVTLEPSKLVECQNKRQPLFSETSIVMVRNRKEESDQLALYRMYFGASSPNTEGAFVLRNIRPGQYSFTPRFFARYWYLKSMVLGSAPPAAPPAKTTSSVKDVARNWVQVKSGDRVTGLVITLSEGAGSIRGQIEKSDDSKVVAGLYAYLVPSERDKSDDPLRYFTAAVRDDGSFSLSNLPPGKYWMIARQPEKDSPLTTDKLRLPDALDARMNIRRAAELTKTEVEVKPCQNLTDYKLRSN